jgi:hypothetical protein
VIGRHVEDPELIRRCLGPLLKALPVFVLLFLRYLFYLCQMIRGNRANKENNLKKSHS